MAQHLRLRPRHFLPLLLFFTWHFQVISKALSIGGKVPGFNDLRTCAKDCLTTDGPYNIDNTTGCATSRCICIPNTIAVALSLLAKCISAQPGSDIVPEGCGDESQQDAAAKVLKAACKLEGFNVDTVARADSTESSAQTTETTIGTYS
jgi:hypothetical protein